jgi:DNA-binding SARP family transcriptional activator
MTQPEFRVLGPVEVRRGNETLPIGDKALAVSVGLLMSANELVSVDALMEWAWGGKLPAHPRAALHNVLSRLRGLFGPGVIETQRTGYRLLTDAEHLDLLKFRKLSDAAADSVRRGRDPETADLLAEALALWRPPPLANVDSPLSARDVVGRLTDQFMNAHEIYAQACLRLRRYHVVIEQLSAQVDAYPYRESLAGLLMLAQLRSGRRADALTTYEMVRTALCDGLGIDPGIPLQQLYLQILQNSRSRPSGRTTGLRPMNLREPRDEPITRYRDSLGGNGQTLPT